MKRFRLDLAYDGTAFSGWAVQPSLRTVQGVIEAALHRVLPKSEEPAPRLVVAGRTDAGVHATAQVAHFDLPAATFDKISSRSGHSLDEQVQLKLSSALKKDQDIVIHSITEVSSDFDARFSALSRRYEYRIADQLSVNNPLRRFDRVRIKDELDLDTLNGASEILLGLQDFAAFCKPRPEATTIRQLNSFSWQRDADNVLVATLEADAFCHSMVRSVVGAVCAVAQGALGLARLAQLLEADQRSSEFKVMPAAGLTLVRVDYPPAQELSARATQTRARRDLPGQDN